MRWVGSGRGEVSEGIELKVALIFRDWFDFKSEYFFMYCFLWFLGVTFRLWCRGSLVNVIKVVRCYEIYKLKRRKFVYGF